MRTRLIESDIFLTRFGPFSERYRCFTDMFFILFMTTSDIAFNSFFLLFLSKFRANIYGK